MIFLLFAGNTWEDIFEYYCKDTIYCTMYVTKLVKDNMDIKNAAFIILESSILIIINDNC